MENPKTAVPRTTESSADYDKLARAVRNVANAASQYLASVKSVKQLGLAGETLDDVMRPRLVVLNASIDALADELDDMEVGS